MYGNNYSQAHWSDGTTSVMEIRIWVDPYLDELEKSVRKFVSESQKRLAVLFEWTRRALAFWRVEHRRPVRAAQPAVRLPERSRVCSLAEAWRVRGPP